MKRISEEEAIRLLKKYSSRDRDFDAVLRHVKAVQRLALEIASKIPGADMEFIKGAALLHDIGRFKTGIEGKEIVKHGIFGSEILRREDLDDYALVAERHMGAGISKEDVIEEGLELPLKDYVPLSKEEKIISHADKLISGDKRISIDAAVDRFNKELGKKVGDKIRKQAEEVEGMKKS